MDGNIFDLDLLAAELKNRIEEERLSVRGAGEQIGCSASTLTRILQGSKTPNTPEWKNLARVIDWLGANPSDFEPNKRRPEGHSTIADVEVHLRALPNINEADAEALVAMVKAAYDKGSEIRRQKKKRDRPSTPKSQAMG